MSYSSCDCFMEYGEEYVLDAQEVAEFLNNKYRLKLRLYKPIDHDLIKNLIQYHSKDENGNQLYSNYFFKRIYFDDEIKESTDCEECRYKYTALSTLKPHLKKRFNKKLVSTIYNNNKYRIDANTIPKFLPDSINLNLEINQKGTHFEDLNFQFAQQALECALDLCKARNSNKNYQDWCRVFLPYILVKLDNGKFILLGRDYKPLGCFISTGLVHYDYNKFPQLTVNYPTVSKNIVLYDDCTKPWLSKKFMDLYIERLNKLINILKENNDEPF